MTVANKTRIYELAKELKIEPKRVIEEARREGVDVSVPSNSVPKEVAEKIRNKYFPKKDAAPVRGIKVIKKKVEEPEIVTSAVETVGTESAVQVQPVAPEVKTVQTVQLQAAPEKAVVEKPQVVSPQSVPQRTVKVISKPKVVAPVEAEVITPIEIKPVEHIEPVTAETAAPIEVPVVQEIAPQVVVPVEVEAADIVLEDVTEITEEKTVEAQTVAVPVPTKTGAKVFNPLASGTRILKPTKEALDKGFVPGTQVVVTPKAVPLPPTPPPVENKVFEPRPLNRPLVQPARFQQQ
ncbi:MAG: translation initiation factor IF-2 N-terminal domain-containing protein, partial [Pyrinomonadaceae bacterium]|nr:translation initiation factor IF-2 N-terminal domain-containing protein [Pyrinomonadaceae bacterium]